MINRFNIYYYLLFMLLIFGAFASMAQNHYGIQILGMVALAFSLIFLIQFVHVARTKTPDRLTLAELGSLVILSGILVMRVFYFGFPFVEVVFGAAGVVLIGSYLVKLAKSWKSLKSRSKSLAALIVVFLASIIAYTISLTIGPFASSLAEPFGILGFVLLIVFSVVAFRKGNMLVDGERVSAFRYLPQLQDRSIVLATLFLVFTAYLGLTRIGIIPKMHFDQYPQAYYELVNRSEVGGDKTAEGKPQHKAFKDGYDKFVERYGLEK